MITSSSIVRPRLGSMTRRAQALVRACHYWREYSTCLTSAEESALRARIPGDAFPVREPADQLALERHWKAEARVGDFVDVIAAIKTDPAVDAATRRTLSLLGGSALTLHGFGPGWENMGTVSVLTDREEEEQAAHSQEQLNQMVHSRGAESRAAARAKQYEIACQNSNRPYTGGLYALLTGGVR